MDIGRDVMRKTLAHFPSGVTGVCALEGGRPFGMAASSFCSVSLHPPMVLFCAANSSLTWPRLRRARAIGISVLSASQGELCRQLAGPPERRFQDVGWTATEDGAVMLEGAAAWLECHLENEVPAGDHVVVLLHVDAVMTSPGTEPLVFHQSRFRALGD
jgi:flavin reductase (DIM6/NTAB) family NADH-FMN oxidoreductase RutF